MDLSPPTSGDAPWELSRYFTSSELITSPAQKGRKNLRHLYIV